MKLSNESIAVLRLSAIKGLGLKTFHLLYQRYGSAESICQAEHAELRAAGISSSISRAICDLRDDGVSDAMMLKLERIDQWLEGDNTRLVTLSDEDYPLRLRQIYHAPPILYLKGNASVLNMPTLAVVGSRKASPASMNHAREFAQSLVLQGINIVSGLALGVDTCAHEGAVQSAGVTTAVLGTGIDVVYPRQNRALADQIAEQGLILSEMPLGTMPLPANFPRRNRVVSGLSDGVLIVEATAKSGSLITARYALEQNREVFAIPGPIDSPGAAGTNDLIKQGAQLVTGPEDIMDALSFNRVVCVETNEIEGAKSENHLKASADPHIELSHDEREVNECISFSTTSFDSIVEQCAKDASVIAQSLLMLELKGLIAQVAGGYQRIKALNSCPIN